jgi:hypothetical protein
VDFHWQCHGGKCRKTSTQIGYRKGMRCSEAEGHDKEKNLDDFAKYQKSP